ncbi:Rv0909 family putative TA system antitoxin [Corynebacterium sp. ES2794-CONJ1]|uniref:Rv0909 family putative TA system antitoxin n=1 Tax=unclassified Corynebacterium TaxID=2624378 RepID=UPI0021673BF9|nr:MULTISPECIES: Rv0909 family putative TA system antitoxin [unclassified Corynebacterium]MCS4489385.1 Rv0909 family putative TA system antitoxin [Corynebacterium sp. ES2775-CONJ]MCS4491197.1 Rv0909 family putative TA system antitoxin [Corynebacterium sp. ES2715-CONJ3]MCU9518288.1 Rv0909 family putative TA system antitoxin [Corynebacterium sp. ES2794-CONJ1]
MSLADKAKQLLNSDQGEKFSDAALDKAADLAKEKLGEDKAAKIDSLREKADRKLGNQ